MAIRRKRCVKIVATLGPASEDYETIKSLFLAGADVFRLNMSHGTHESLKERYDIIRRIGVELEREIGILADLQGPKLRVGAFEEKEIMLKEGQRFRFDLDPAPGNKDRVQLPHPEIFESLREGAHLLVNDGKIRVRVEACGANFADCVVVVPGVISNRKGVNVPDVILPLRALSTKDRVDLEFAASLGVDWVALSFVQRPEDVEEAKALLKGRAAILAKIEKPAAIDAFDEILEVSDGIMVARGDLGVELPVYSVPPIQKKIIRACRAMGKPVIVATQMLESMIESPMPTRAEVSDVAQAIYEGADAIMLSAESAAGAYPVESVKMMDNIAEVIEADPNYRSILDSTNTPAKTGVADAIMVAARGISETTRVCAIATFTQSGATARLAARERPNVPILTLASEKSVARRLSLSWGLHCLHLEKKIEYFDDAVVEAIKSALDYGFGTEKDNIIVTAGVPFNTSGSTNIIRITPLDLSLFCQE